MEENIKENENNKAYYKITKFRRKITQHTQEGQEVELKESKEKSEVKGIPNQINKNDLNWEK